MNGNETIDRQRTIKMEGKSSDLTDEIAIKLDRATVIILGDLLEQLIDDLIDDKKIDRSQAFALNNLECSIEAVCVDAFKAEYAQLLDRAKKEIEYSGED